MNLGRVLLGPLALAFEPSLFKRFSLGRGVPREAGFREGLLLTGAFRAGEGPAVR